MMSLLINIIPYTLRNDNTNVTQINKLVGFNDNNYFTKKIKHTSETINNITRHTHNKYERNVIQKFNKHYAQSAY